MSRIFVDGEPFSRAHRSRAWSLVNGWVRILGLLGYDDNENLHPSLLDAVQERAVEFIDLHFSKTKSRLIYAPDALAAAALYIACVEKNVKVSQVLISWLAGRTEKWVRDNYKKLWKELGLRDTGRDLFEAG